jgi:hypothetical protein
MAHIIPYPGGARQRENKKPARFRSGTWQAFGGGVQTAGTPYLARGWRRAVRASRRSAAAAALARRLSDMALALAGVFVVP